VIEGDQGAVVAAVDGMGEETVIDGSQRSWHGDTPCPSVPKVPACGRTFRRPRPTRTGGLFRRANEVAETPADTSGYRPSSVESARPEIQGKMRFNIEGSAHRVI